MLMEQRWRYKLNKADLDIFDQFLPAEDPLIDAAELIPWESFTPILEKFYSADRGQPAYSPVMVFKIEFLRYQFGLSDTQVIRRCQTDILFRWFLQIPARFQLPDSSTLCRFRGRLGKEGFKNVFDQVVKVARQAGLVKDRLRLKDASHVIANIAVPTTIKLLGQLRDRLLEQLEVFDQEAAEGYRIAAESMRQETAAEDATRRLEARTGLIEDILDCIDKLAVPEDAATNRAWQSLCNLVTTGKKILQDQENPDAGRKTLSPFDTEARRGKHGQWYEGYTVDVMMDADSELITSLQVLQAGGDEAKSCVELVHQEQETHGNKIEEVSIDGAGFNGPMLRTFEQELVTKVVTPPKELPGSSVFPSSAFVISEDGSKVTCPAGQESSYRQRDTNKNSTIYRFKRAQCDGCPFAAQCIKKLVHRPV